MEKKTDKDYIAALLPYAEKLTNGENLGVTKWEGGFGTGIEGWEADKEYMIQRCHIPDFCFLHWHCGRPMAKFKIMVRRKLSGCGHVNKENRWHNGFNYTFFVCKCKRCARVDDVFEDPLD
jgi:hypothetical protein